MKRNSTIANKRYTFKPALELIPRGRYNDVKCRICDILGFQNPSTWSRCLKGYSPTYGAALEVNKVFAEFGIHQAWTEVI